MAFLLLNGIAVSVNASKGDRSTTDVGDRTRAFDGTMRQTIVARKRSWAVVSKPLVQADADALAFLVQGRGHSWAYDATNANNGLYSSKGLGGTVVGTVTSGTASGKYGSYLAISAASKVTYAAGLTGDYTVMFWRLETAVWHHYVIRSTGGVVTKWKDAVSNDAVSTTFVVISGGNLQLGDGTNADAFDDVVALPFSIAPAQTWISAIFAAGVAWTPLPQLGASGNMTSGATVNVLGQVTRETPAPFMSGGTWQVGARVVEYTLDEV